MADSAVAVDPDREDRSAGATLTELEQEQIDKISKLIAKQYSEMLCKHSVKIGHGRHRDGECGIGNDADSDDDDLDKETLDDIRHRMLDQIKPISNEKGETQKRPRRNKRKLSKGPPDDSQKKQKTETTTPQTEVTPQTDKPSGTDTMTL